MTTPSNSAGFQKPRTGIAYSGIFIEGYWKEYICCELNDTLKPNINYCLGIYVSMGNAFYSLDKLGILLTNDSIVRPTDPAAALSYYTPQVENPTGVCISDSLNWVKIAGTFTAMGGEKFITIGVFADDIDITYCELTPWLWPRTYYYIDDVFLYECTDTLSIADAGADTGICMGDSVLLGTTEFPDYYYTWTGPGITNDTLGKIWVSPLVNTTYYLVQKDFAFNETIDSITITVTNCEPTAYAGNDTAICLGDSVRIGSSAFHDYQYSWINSVNDTVHGGLIWVRPAETSTWHLIQTDRFGYLSYDSILIEVDDCFKPLTIPNVFTPNNDGLNDQFKIENPGKYPYRITIYSRWGFPVFTGNESSVWDGKFQHKELAEGVLFYLIKVWINPDKELVYNGIIHIIR